jgi:MFS superfamily sulfate permease-like transporter
MTTERTEAIGLASGVPFLLAGFLIWVAGEIFIGWPAQPSQKLEIVEEIEVLPAAKFNLLNLDFDLPLMLRFLGLALAFTMSLLTLAWTSNNRFTTPGVIAWAVSIVLWVIILAPREWSVSAFVNSVRGIRLPHGWTLALLVGIMFVAVLFRFTNLNGIPSEMTSDHVEKILDSQRILDGNPQVFFPNNGGREPIQFYLMAIISQIPSLGMDFFTLKFLTAVEGLICIPILWWMGREIIGDDEPQLGNAVGLLLAALVAVSYWHTMLSRLGLRIVLTVIVTGLLMIFLSRAIRRNRRGDFIKAGLVLGAGVYGYQAVRMLPVVVVAGVVLAVVFSLFRSGRREQITRYLVNLVVLVVITLAVFVPMAGFARDYPEDFWRRTSGRLLGDDTVQITDANGQIITRNATIEERMSAFQENIGILVNNIRNALLMYNWKGDVAWITAVPNRPEMDVFTGSLLIVGLGAWGVRMVKRRDPADWLMPAALFIMLLPSALSIAYPIENPSATRTSGSLPEAYLFAAFPLALVWLAIGRLFPRWGKVAGSAVVGVILLVATSANWNMYFVDFNQSYTNSSPAPYTEAGRFLRGFADSGGSLGNAFMIGYPYWWDYRALGIEAGVTDYPNGIYSHQDVPAFIKSSAERTDKYQIDPDKDLLFFYNPADTDSESELQTLFPNGVKQLIHSYKPGDDFMVFRIPKLGAQGLLDFMAKIP